MTKKKLLPRIELILILIFFMAFITWTMRKCSDTRQQYQEEAALEENQPEDVTSVSPDTTAAPAEPEPEAAQPENRRERERAIREKFTPLYVTIDGMNMREEPTLKGKVVGRLVLYEEVTFLNEVTDSTQEIKLGDITANEPWVKVKNQKGKVGWIYGAGVSYYKKKLEGVN
ncbi:MAG: hypothetical protein DHS20C18_13240 [Saprospiraceae bacterium]|nr:MAG: hypothetical protein DHS20C18_13240 [Saprospiraceae bacterium]